MSLLKSNMFFSLSIIWISCYGMQPNDPRFKDWDINDFLEENCIVIPSLDKDKRYKNKKHLLEGMYYTINTNKNITSDAKASYLQQLANHKILSEEKEIDWFTRITSALTAGGAVIVTFLCLSK